MGHNNQCFWSHIYSFASDCNEKVFCFCGASVDEEVSRFFFIYTISFGAGLAQREGYFVSMDYFYRKFNAKMKWIIDLLISSVSAVLFLVMAVYSLYFISLGLEETSPSLGIPMAIAFASMFIMSGTVLFYVLKQLIHDIKSANK